MMLLKLWLKLHNNSHEENTQMTKHSHLNTILVIHSSFQEIHKPEIKNT